jgi:uncharacterized heparinase superfamily protein
MTEDVTASVEADSIEAGRRLVRARGEGVSLSERLTNYFYRLTWKTPLHAIRLRGRYPLKLLAVPKDPVPGDEQAGRAMIGGTIAWHGEKTPVDDYDFSGEGVSPALADYMQSFAWLRDLAAVGARADAAPIAEKLTRAWIAKHGEVVSDVAWRGDLWGKRIMYWAAHAPLILSSTDLVYRSSVLNSLARGARHLDRIADRTQMGIPRVIAWCGVVTAGLLIAGGDPRRSFGEAGLHRAIAAAFTNDGGSLCRSPQNQLDAVMILSMLQSVYDARKMQLPEMVEDAFALIVPALLGVTLGDGGLSSWQGTPGISADRVQGVIKASGVRARPLRQPRDWGYQRLSAGETIVIVDAAPPPVSRVASGGCASTLAFELSDGPHRLVVNCGGARAGGILIPAALAEGLRTTAAHSTMTLADNNSTAILSDGSVGKGVTEIELDRQETDGGTRVEVSHDGYARRFGFVHKRAFMMTPDGKEVRCEDTLLPAEGKKKPSATNFALRFHLGDGVEASPTADGQGALLRISEGALWQFRCRGGRLAIDESIWVDGDGRPHPTQQIVVTGETAAGGATVGWVLRRAG